MDLKQILSREVNATIIPAGDAVKLPAGTKFTVTHRLGGNFTILTDYGIFRILGKDADALNEPIPQELIEQPTAANAIPHSGPPDEKAVWDKLKAVFDPEIPVNIVDLGLVYSMDIQEVEPTHYAIHVNMTLTAPGCGMGPTIAEDAKQKLMTVPGVQSAHVEIVWDPPWTQDMISEEGKMQLGLI